MEGKELIQIKFPFRRPSILRCCAGVLFYFQANKQNPSRQTGTFINDMFSFSVNLLKAEVRSGLVARASLKSRNVWKVFTSVVN